MNPTPTEAEVKDAVERLTIDIGDLHEASDHRTANDLRTLLSALKSAQSDTARHQSEAKRFQSDFVKETKAHSDTLNLLLKWRSRAAEYFDQYVFITGRTFKDALDGMMVSDKDINTDQLCKIIDDYAAMLSDNKGAGKA